jgi:L-fuconolactonase
MEASSEFVPPILLDHLAIMQPRTPPAASQPRADLPKMLDLARRQNTVIKVSGACRPSSPSARPTA